jgi:hypothetical protein
MEKLSDTRSIGVPETSLPQVSVGFGTLQSFEFTQRAARALANSTLVPEAYRARIWNKRKKEFQDNPNAIPNCIIALNMSSRLGADTLMVMQNLHIIEGRPSWSSQFIISGINTCGRFSQLRFEMSAPEPEREVSYEYTEWVNNDRVSKTGRVVIKNRTCRAWAVEKATGDRLDGPEVSIEMAVAEGWFTKNGSKWRTIPEIMLCYRAASFFGRLHAPELQMGFQSTEEIRDVLDAYPSDDGGFVVDLSEPIEPDGPEIRRPAPVQGKLADMADLPADVGGERVAATVNSSPAKFSLFGAES